MQTVHQTYQGTRNHSFETCEEGTSYKQLEILQNKILQTYTKAPWFVRNTRIRRDLKIPTIEETINNDKQKL